MILSCHVDDIMISISNVKVNWLVEKLNQSFKINRFGELLLYNRRVSVRDWKAGTLLIHQDVFIGKLLVERFFM